MLLSAVSVLVVAQSILEILEGLMNNPVLVRGIVLPAYAAEVLAVYDGCLVENSNSIGCWVIYMSLYVSHSCAV
jgi:hypothetical protein